MPDTDTEFGIHNSKFRTCETSIHKMAEAYHIPVLLKESVDALNIDPSGVYVDATLGGGGHTGEILSRLGPEGRLIVFDMDADALANAPDDSRVHTVHNNFRFVKNYVRYLGFGSVDGILADLGVSSHQFDTSDRGFSFRFEESSLDMRMNTGGGRTAGEILNTYPEERIAGILFMYGEVEHSRRIAGLICRAREKSPIVTSADLTEALKPVLPPVNGHKTLARIYQALRIEVNGELSSLEHFLYGAAASLRPGGILSVITYHSLEDRMVKNFIKDGYIGDAGQKTPEDPYNLIHGIRGSVFRAVNRHPIVPSEEEISANTRARSAKLRIAEKI